MDSQQIQEIDAEEILERYAAGERNFANTCIEGSDELAGADLRNVDFSNSILAEMMLDRVNFSAANLTKAHFGLSSLYFANLQGADLGEAILTFSELTGANFDKCKISKCQS